jgi:hypothetical protein
VNEAVIMRGFEAIEQALLREVGADGPLSEAVRKSLEALLDELLHTLPVLDVPVTDGLIIRRDEVRSLGFWALCKVYLLEAPNVEPAWCELEFRPGRVHIASGRVLFGIDEARVPQGVRRSKLENQLLAFPHDALDSVPWRLEFKREASGWTRVHERSER